MAASPYWVGAIVPSLGRAGRGSKAHSGPRLLSKTVSRSGGRPLGRVAGGAGRRGWWQVSTEGRVGEAGTVGIRLGEVGVGDDGRPDAPAAPSQSIN